MNDLLIWLANFLPEGWIPQNSDEATGWTIVGVLIAFAALIFTAIATLFTVLGYFKKPAVVDAASGNKHDQNRAQAHAQDHAPDHTFGQSVTGNNNAVIQVGGNVQGSIHVSASQAESAGNSNGTNSEHGNNS